ncbi:hypothetical protein TorRG33x02_307420 [Trema orientale]|uniref:Uncharacterized protein n=1 Tax=Trema orientale TaxID=63057 RepID=A0A2P5BVH1_TREOI|nr:hypothetical protein TorRG33x02_307420 [Trema orientale]
MRFIFSEIINVMVFLISKMDSLFIFYFLNITCYVLVSLFFNHSVFSNCDTEMSFILLLILVPIICGKLLFTKFLSFINFFQFAFNFSFILVFFFF